MKKILAGLIEAIHLLATAFLFACAFWLSPLTAPIRNWEFAGEVTSVSSRIASEMQKVMLDRGAWIAAGALMLLALAGFLRGDGKKMFGLLRLVACGASLLFAMWAAFGLPEKYLYRPWNCLLVATALNLLLTGFLVGGGGGGGGGSSSSSSSDKKK